jgi:hypothetical protein
MASPLTAPDYDHRGILVLTIGTLLISGKPNLPSDNNGPARGAIIFEQLLNS